MSFTYPFPRPSVTVDLVVQRQDGKILLIKRGRAGTPFHGHYALPGGFVDPDESTEAAAVRELKEETGLDAIDLSLIGVFSEPGRDPRGHVITIAYKATVTHEDAVAGDDASETKWATHGEICGLQMAFDHAKIIDKALGPVFCGLVKTGRGGGNQKPGAPAPPRCPYCHTEMVGASSTEWMCNNQKCSYNGTPVTTGVFPT